MSSSCPASVAEAVADSLELDAVSEVLAEQATTSAWSVTSESLPLMADTPFGHPEPALTPTLGLGFGLALPSVSGVSTSKFDAVLSTTPKLLHSDMSKLQEDSIPALMDSFPRFALTGLDSASFLDSHLAPTSSLQRHLLNSTLAPTHEKAYECLDLPSFHLKAEEQLRSEQDSGSMFKPFTSSSSFVNLAHVTTADTFAKLPLDSASFSHADTLDPMESLRWTRVRPSSESVLCSLSPSSSPSSIKLVPVSSNESLLRCAPDPAISSESLPSIPVFRLVSTTLPQDSLGLLSRPLGSSSAPPAPASSPLTPLVASLSQNAIVVSSQPLRVVVAEPVVSPSTSMATVLPISVFQHQTLLSDVSVTVNEESRSKRRAPSEGEKLGSGKRATYHDLIRKSYIESISCFKCKLCGFLGVAQKAVEDHVLLAHDDHLLAFDRNDADDSAWLGVAQQEGIPLECPYCSNKFCAEGSRSFKVHVVDDHGLNERDAEKQLLEATRKRREATVERLRRKRAEDRERRRQTHAKDLWEAYVDGGGQLRVRINGAKAEQRKPTLDSEQRRMDVSAADYILAVDAQRRTEKARKAGQPMPDILLDENQKAIAGICASKVNAGAKCDKKRARGELNADSESEDGEDEDGVDVRPTAPKRRRIGRPKGSRTIGVTRLKRINPKMRVSEEHMGSVCGVHDCAVRVRDADKLAYHRRCHAAADDGGEAPFECPECQLRTPRWSALAAHLWKTHAVDVELYACHHCQHRSYSKAKHELHLLGHKEKKRFLCDDCGKAFSSEKSRKLHSKLHGGARSAKAVCRICHRTFLSVRQRQLHIEAVHAKVKPHLCNYCGYSASSVSSLRLHLRTHTGEKPYVCDSAACDYRTADHNSLRRHKMKHSGEKPYKCLHCDYSCIQSSTYKAHLKSKHPNTANDHMFQCQKCLFKTVKEGNFLAHLADHGTAAGQVAVTTAATDTASEAILQTHSDLAPETSIETFVSSINL